MNLRNLSELTGYSVSTISKAFSDSKELNAQTKSAILSKAKELGCYEKYSKNKYGKKIVAVICPETSSAFYTNLLTVLNGIIEKNNATMTVSVTDFSAAKEADLISFYSSQKRSDGIIVLEGSTRAKKNQAVPLIFMNSMTENHYCDCVNTDFYSGICEAIEVFKRNGHKKIAYIGEKLTFDKQSLFVKAMEFHGMKIDPSLIVCSNERFEDAGYNAMEKLISDGNLPTAVLAAYDYIALGAIHSMERHGLKMPDDVSIIGIDDIQFAAYHKISLSSINTNREEVCNLLTKILFRKMNNANFSVVQSVSVKSRLVNRNSVRKLPQ